MERGTLYRHYVNNGPNLSGVEIPIKNWPDPDNRVTIYGSSPVIKSMGILSYSIFAVINIDVVDILHKVKSIWRYNVYTENVTFTIPLNQISLTSNPENKPTNHLSTGIRVHSYSFDTGTLRDQ